MKQNANKQTHDHFNSTSKRKKTPITWKSWLICVFPSCMSTKPITQKCDRLLRCDDWSLVGKVWMEKINMEYTRNQRGRFNAECAWAQVQFDSSSVLSLYRAQPIPIQRKLNRVAWQMKERMNLSLVLLCVCVWLCSMHANYVQIFNPQSFQIRIAKISNTYKSFSFYLSICAIALFLVRCFAWNSNGFPID